MPQKGIKVKLIRNSSFSLSQATALSHFRLLVTFFFFSLTHIRKVEKEKKYRVKTSKVKNKQKKQIKRFTRERENKESINIIIKKTSSQQKH